jgi:murein DD-endopeptidase MepM/ murein hydrolase activator NlpD
MADHPFTDVLTYPLADYQVNSYGFGEDCWYDGVHWGIHLGEDVNTPPATAVRSIGRGRVVYSALHPGSRDRRNWGNIVIAEHLGPGDRLFYSLYAHLGVRLVSVGVEVKLDDPIGSVGAGPSPENGWWEDSHLHFGIYIGQWDGAVLPGYWRPTDDRTRRSDWRAPSVFINSYPALLERTTEL